MATRTDYRTARPVRLPRLVQRRQRGYIMVVSMMILLLITIMSISMARSFFLEEDMAGNIREKTRSFNAAQTAVSYAEWFVTNGGSSGGTNCPSTTPVLTAPTVCTNAAVVNATPNATTMPLQVYYPVPFNSTTSTFLQVQTTGGVDKFYGTPGVYIQFLGFAGSDYVFQITGYGYGGSLNSVSVIQTVYLASPAATPL